VKRNLSPACLRRGAILLLLGGIASAKPLPQSAAPGQTATAGPIAALRDILSAACAENEEGFARFLTARNAQSFAHLTAASRVALMKRFVLLDEPGKSSVTLNPSGRPTVECVTPAFTNEMQIGGADTQENLAFLPLEIRAKGTQEGEARHIQIGLVREGGEWKLLSAGLLLLDLPALELEWNRETLDVNEREALERLKRLAQAVEAYRLKYTRLPENLARLGPPRQGPPSPEASGLIDAELAAGKKSGYSFRYVIEGGSALGAPAKYELAAVPLIYGTTGRRSFYRDSDGGLHAADRQGALASRADAKVE
jgi:hypothetical protein